MKSTDTLDSGKKFSYSVDFRYKKFDKDLQPSAYAKSTLTVTVDEAVPEPMQRLWTKIIGEINPNYFEIEIIDVRSSTK